MFYKYFMLICSLFAVINSIVLNNFGKFELKVLNYELQTYERLKSVASVVAVCDTFQNGTIRVSFHVDIKKNTGIIGMKMRIFLWNEAEKKFVLSHNMAMKNICENHMTNALLTLIPWINKDCTMQPGVYNFTIADFNEFIHVIVNDKFFYGKYSVISEIYVGKYGKIVKTNVTALINPINKT